MPEGLLYVFGNTAGFSLQNNPLQGFGIILEGKKTSSNKIDTVLHIRSILVGLGIGRREYRFL